MKRTFLIVASALMIMPPASGRSQLESDPFASFTRAWREDPVWHDGQAELAVYEATRDIYGQSRRYAARMYTNKELADKQTKTKSATGRGREVFKHHLREDITTQHYTIHYSTMCYVGTTDLKSLKIDMGSQEDCGATFKQFVNHAGICQWHQFSYFPNEGRRSGQYPPTKSFVFQDALSLVLRGYPFDAPMDLSLMVVPDQTSNLTTRPRPQAGTVKYVGFETLKLPVGQVDAHHVTFNYNLGVVLQGGEGKPPIHHYWFAAEQSAPWLCVMVRYEGPEGTSYKLREHRRWAYWKP